MWSLTSPSCPLPDFLCAQIKLSIAHKLETAEAPEYIHNGRPLHSTCCVGKTKRQIWETGVRKTRPQKPDPHASWPWEHWQGRGRLPVHVHQIPLGRHRGVEDSSWHHLRESQSVLFMPLSGCLGGTRTPETPLLLLNYSRHTPIGE